MSVHYSDCWRNFQAIAQSISWATAQANAVTATTGRSIDRSMCQSIVWTVYHSVICWKLLYPIINNDASSLIITDYLTVHAVYLSVLVDASNVHAMHKLVENYYFLFFSKTCFLTRPKSGLIFKNSIIRYSEKE